MNMYKVIPDSRVLRRYSGSFRQIGPEPHTVFSAETESEARTKLTRELIRAGVSGYAAFEIAESAHVTKL